MKRGAQTSLRLNLHRSQYSSSFLPCSLSPTAGSDPISLYTPLLPLSLHAVTDFDEYIEEVVRHVRLLRSTVH